MFFKKAGAQFAGQFVFELTAMEILAFQEEKLAVPKSHIKQLAVGFQLFLDRLKDPKAWREQFDKAEIYSNTNISSCFKLMNNPHFVVDFQNPRTAPQFYRVLQNALKIVARRPQPKLKDIFESAKEACLAGYFYLDWNEQLNLLRSLIGVYNEFGGATNPEDIQIYNDWLDERMMQPLAFYTLIAE